MGFSRVFDKNIVFLLYFRMLFDHNFIVNDIIIYELKRGGNIT